MRVEAADSELLTLPRRKLARALGVEDPELVMVETDGMARGVVTVYREHPLLTVREATPDDLRMDARGRIAIGLRHDGRPARWPLYDPELGALTDLLVGAPGSGKSVTLLTLLAAERINGVVSIVADAQDGMSLPEAAGRVAHFGAGQAQSAATLAAVSAVASYRQQESAARGWGSFVLGKPWRLVILTMDEINRMIAEDSGLPQEFRKWVAGMLGAGQITWRKVGVGVRIAGQSIHLQDLAHSEKIRANAKQGSVWLGRVNSSMTRSMAADMSSGNTEITPVPKYFGAGGAEELEAAWGGEEAPTGPVTAGTAWLIQSGQPYLSRVWRAIKRERTYPGLIDLMESAPVPDFTPEEAAVFRQAYAEALAAAERLLGGEADEDGGREAAPPRRERSAGPAAPSVPAPPRTLRDQVLEALAGGPLRTREIRAAVGVGTEGGPASGSVDNALSKLQDEGLVVRAGHGVWALPGHQDTPQED
ncbi:conjugal transfer protein TraA [Streptomyces sp. TRM43335]|uniref:Conjugal transfer protein TraA n=1 Tax=Streptomyces taklimakanensis TaxID=2569853 RepID=A0A6G2BKG7_9ACTN|nr:conjugal transfer protein TraA [Streptomyces taklimakanensis]